MYQMTIIFPLNDIIFRKKTSIELCSFSI